MKNIIKNGQIKVVLVRDKIWKTDDNKDADLIIDVMQSLRCVDGNPMLFGTWVVDGDREAGTGTIRLTVK